MTIAGTSWSLYKGPNGSTTVFSFVASSQVANFSGVVKAFFTYPIASQGLSSSQYLTSVGAGTGKYNGSRLSRAVTSANASLEPFTGSNAKFTVSAYSMVIK